MKIRNGFVSNSSSSSFCVDGIVPSSDDLMLSGTESMRRPAASRSDETRYVSMPCAADGEMERHIDEHF